ncbi:MAG: ABC transporter permease [Chloroflexota bacterium]
MKVFREYAPTLVLLVILVGLWEFMVIWREVPNWILPTPSAIVQALWNNIGILTPHVGQTLLEVGLGLGCAIIIGLGLAALLDVSPWLRRAVYPILVTSQTIPILALAPLLVVWFGFGIMPKILIVVLFCFFPVAINTSDGLNAADPEYIDLLRAMGANRYQIWRKVRLPASLPYFFSGLRIAATYSVVAAIVGEWVGAQQGLGIYMLRSANAFRTESLFAAIVISSVLSLLIFFGVFIAERVAIPWHSKGKS